MAKFIVQLLLMAGVFLVVSHMVPGFQVASFGTAVFAAIVFGVVNALVRPFLIVVTLPVTVLTVGLFLLVVNAALMGITAFMVPGFSISGFVPALLGWILVSLGGFVISMLLKK